MGLTMERYEQAVQGLLAQGCCGDHYTEMELQEKLGCKTSNIIGLSKRHGWRQYGYGRYKLYAKEDVDAYLNVTKPEGWVTIDEAVALVGCSYNTLYQAALRGRWPKQRWGRTNWVLWREADVLAYKLRYKPCPGRGRAAA